MQTWQLYLSTILIWGSTWIAITFQLGTVPVTVSLAWRFGLASLMLWLWLGWRKLPVRFTLQQHGWLFLLGLCQYGINYALIYLAEMHISSGLVAVLFTAIIGVNLLGSRVFFHIPITRRSAGGALLGMLGVALVFLPELQSLRGDAKTLQGIGLGLLAALFASAGNLLSARNARDNMGVMSGNAVSMAYGAGTMLLVSLQQGHVPSIPLTVPYVSSLLYLAFFGSVLAFGAYLTLIARIGPAKASYAGVLIPLVALLLSTFFEDYQWHLSAFFGMALCLSGNVLMLRK